MNPDEVLYIYSRSSMGYKYDVSLTNCVGVIDSDFYNNEDNEGHFKIKLINHGDKDFEVKIALNNKTAKYVYTENDFYTIPNNTLVNALIINDTVVSMSLAEDYEIIKGNAVGDLMFYGRGAGDLPTGSAVVSDIISIVRTNINFENPIKVVKNNLWNKEMLPMGEVRSKYYIRATVDDKPGVLSDITTNYERIADHCSNIAIGIIQSKEDIYESHEYIETLDKGENTPFYEKYEEYKERYVLP